MAENGSAGPDHRARLARARAEAAAAGLDGLWIGPGPNFRWLTGESAHPGGWPLWLSAVLVPTEGEPALLVSKMHAEIFDLERCPVTSVFTYVDGDDPSARWSALAATGLTGSSRVGGEDSLCSRRRSRQLTAPTLPAAGEPRLDRLRAVRTSGKSSSCGAPRTRDAGYRRAVESCGPGSPSQGRGALDRRGDDRAGSEELAISGAFQADRPAVAAGEIVDVDLFPAPQRLPRGHGAEHLLGEPLARGAAALRRDSLLRRCSGRRASGSTAESVHVACADAMREAGYEQVWKVGHGVGLGDAHEPPLLQTGNTDLIEEGMVFTVDPGAFVARDTPIHIEDTVVVTANGCTALNMFTRELQEV